MLLEGITPDGEIREATRRQVMGELRAAFRPEFLNRVDEVVLFKPLQLSEITRIVALLAGQLGARLAEQGVALELTPAALEHIAREAYDPVYGARPLKRYLQRELETRIARSLIAGQVRAGTRLVVDDRDGALEIDIEARPAAERSGKQQTGLPRDQFAGHG
jgi:ATP-dependent Clp protease ATP-binding subunit ClpB